jgi:hypothetical protein
VSKKAARAFELPAEAPTRSRAYAFGKPIAPWRARRALAIQDAIDAKQGSRDWATGETFTGPGVEIVTMPGEVPITPAQHRLAQALAYHRRHGAAAIVRASTKVADAQAANEPAAIVLWSEIAEELKTIKAEALRAERGRG